MVDSPQLAGRPLRVLSLFTGVGGLDLGFETAGHVIVEQCENWSPARRVLQHRFPKIPLHDDVRTLRCPGEHDVLLAGFPCTDISHAGHRKGINGEKSGLVAEVFRIARETRPAWLLLENVPNLLTLHAGEGMRFITERLDAIGYRWAYRTVDSRFTGIPQRRPRVLILASREHDPRPVLLGEDAGPPAEQATADPPEAGSGFYWTEGRTGLGLVRGAIPTLKGGSTLGLPSAPAVWLPGAPLGRRFLLPTVEDGEALQGLPRGWTAAAVVRGEPDLRWKLIGNAVTVGVGRWVGERLCHAGELEHDAPDPIVDGSGRWPNSGWGDADGLHASSVSAWPRRQPAVPLTEVIDTANARPLSHRATTGFLSRLDEVGRAVPSAFYADLEDHQAATRPATRATWRTDATTHARMRAQRSAGTRAEARLEAALLANGLAFTAQRRPEPDLRCRPDFVFEQAKVVVDVRGCFWHACPTHGTSPKVNADRWADKLHNNVARDERHARELRSRGWIVRVVWEHDDPVDAAHKIARCVKRRERQLGASSAE